MSNESLLLDTHDALCAEMKRVRQRLTDLEQTSRAIDTALATAKHDHISVRSALLVVLHDLDRVDLAIKGLAKITLITKVA